MNCRFKGKNLLMKRSFLFPAALLCCGVALGMIIEHQRLQAKIAPRNNFVVATSNSTDGRGSIQSDVVARDSTDASQTTLPIGELETQMHAALSGKTFAQRAQALE